MTRSASLYASSASACRPVRYKSKHQLAPKPLAERMLADEALELADQLRGATTVELRLQVFLGRDEAELLEPRDLGLREKIGAS